MFLHDFETRSTQQLTTSSGTNAFPMWHGQRIYFLSDRDSKRRANIWVLDLKSHRERQVTFFTDYDIDTPALGDDAITFNKAASCIGWICPASA